LDAEKKRGGREEDAEKGGKKKISSVPRSEKKKQTTHEGGRGIFMFKDGRTVRRSNGGEACPERRGDLGEKGGELQSIIFFKRRRSAASRGKGGRLSGESRRLAGGEKKCANRGTVELCKENSLIIREKSRPSLQERGLAARATVHPFSIVEKRCSKGEGAGFPTLADVIRERGLQVCWSKVAS